MGLLFRESPYISFLFFLALFHLVDPFQSVLYFFSMADKYAAFFIALATSRHIVPACLLPAPTFRSLQPTPCALLMDEEPRSSPFYIHQFGEFAYVYTRRRANRRELGRYFPFVPPLSPPSISRSLSRRCFLFRSYQFERNVSAG